MKIEISTTNKDVKQSLEQATKELNEKNGISKITYSPNAGGDFLLLIIENWHSIGVGTAAIIAAIKGKWDKVIINKDGIEFSGKEAREILDEQ